MSADLHELGSEEVDAGPSEVDALLYHYTSAAGLMGIVQNREIWATESNYLNDPTEVGFASRVLEDLLSDYAARGGVSEVDKKRIEFAIALLQRAYSNPHSEEQYVEDRSFITSFSRTDRSLTLWRLYSGQAGFCVGFDKEHLLEWFGEDYPSGDRDQMHAEDREKYDALVLTPFSSRACKMWPTEVTQSGQFSTRS